MLKNKLLSSSFFLSGLTQKSNKIINYHACIKTVKRNLQVDITE
jgi:hypothetical protein